MNNPSSFSSISFEAESAIKFKKLAREQNKTHTQLLNELIEFLPEINEMIKAQKWLKKRFVKSAVNH